MNWDEWRGSLDGRPVFWTKHMMCGFGCHIDLHKMVSADDQGCLHTHPAHAIRVILYGGYIESFEDDTWRMWRPWMIGWVKPALCHRISLLLNDRASYSLWIRFRKIAPVELRGEGWPENMRGPVP